MNQHEPFLYQEIAESLRRQIASGDLKAGDKLPSVRQAARRWNCTPGTVSKAYAQLAQEGLVAGQRGGGTRVTGDPKPVNSVWQWAALVNRAEKFLLEALHSGSTPVQAEAALSVAIARWQSLGNPPAQAVPPADLRFAGSHDLGVEVLARMLEEEQPAARLSLDYTGSLGGLMALAQNKADIAGTHLWDEAADAYNLPFIHRLLPNYPVKVITLFHRSLGLIAAPGNPQNLHNLGDLTQPGLRFINRQPGSGTRVWLDAQLKLQGVDPQRINGYRQEVFTHFAVTDAVKTGAADAGLGIHAAAAASNLHFIPLTQERYDLVFSAAAWNASAGQALLRCVRSTRFREAVSALGGYDVAQTGDEW